MFVLILFIIKKKSAEYQIYIVYHNSVFLMHPFFWLGFWTHSPHILTSYLITPLPLHHPEGDAKWMVDDDSPNWYFFLHVDRHSLQDSVLETLQHRFVKIHHASDLRRPTPRCIWPHISWSHIIHMCDSIQGFYCVQLSLKYIKACGYRDPFSKTSTKGQWPLDDLWPHFFSIEVTYDSTYM